MADLGGAQGVRAPWVSKFFRFHAVFGKIWQNRMLAPPPPPGELAPPPGEILDPPLDDLFCQIYFTPFEFVLCVVAASAKEVCKLSISEEFPGPCL